MNTAKAFIIISALLLTAVAAWPQSLDDKEALAQRAVAEHRFAEARDLYVSLSRNHPENVSYWTSLGRMSGYLGDYASAIAAYDKALAIQPKNVETLVGKAYVLLWQKNFTAASLLLNEAHDLAPDSSEVELAMAQGHYYQNQRKEALGWVRQILVRNPQDAEALDLKSRLRSERKIRIDLGITGDSLSFASSGINGVSGLVDVGLVTPDNFISVRYEDWFRFNQRVTRGGMNFSHTFSHRWTVDASTLIGSRGDALARNDSSVGLKRRFHSGWAVSTAYRNLRFDQANIQLVTPGVEYSFEKPITLQATYSRGWSKYDSLVQSGAPTNSMSLRYNESFAKFTIHAGWSKGVELFTVPLPGNTFGAQLGQFRANTYSTGVDLPVSKILTTKFDYAVQQRSSGATEQIYSAHLVFQR